MINNDNITIYEQKPLMSNYEFKFYKILEELKEEYEIMPQINLASIIKKINQHLTKILIILLKNMI